MGIVSKSKLLGLGFAAGVGWGLVRDARRISFRGKAVLITGGSRGLGLVLARQLGAEGARIALLARDAAELERARIDLEQRGTEVRIIEGDVRTKEGAEFAVRETIRQFGRIDVLINNAGVIQVGPLEHMGVEDFENAMRVHFHGPLHAMLTVLPHMRRQRFGRVVNIASIGGRLAFPHMAPYSASKAGLIGLSDAIRAEVRKDNIFVTTVSPGLMRTGSTGNAFFKGDHRREHAWFAISDSVPFVSIDASAAARRIIEACRHGSPQLVVGLPAKLGALMNGVMPGLTGEIMSWVNRLLPSATRNRRLDSQSGWQSSSGMAPSALTRLSDEAAIENNEIER